jgi:hypothetical protein
MIPVYPSLSFVTRRRFLVVFCTLATLLLAILLTADPSRLASAGAGNSHPNFDPVAAAERPTTTNRIFSPGLITR